MDMINLALCSEVCFSSFLAIIVISKDSVIQISSSVRKWICQISPILRSCDTHVYFGNNNLLFIEASRTGSESRRRGDAACDRET